MPGPSKPYIKKKKFDNEKGGIPSAMAVSGYHNVHRYNQSQDNRDKESGLQHELGQVLSDIEGFMEVKSENGLPRHTNQSSLMTKHIRISNTKPRVIKPKVPRTNLMKQQKFNYPKYLKSFMAGFTRTPNQKPQHMKYPESPQDIYEKLRLAGTTITKSNLNKPSSPPKTENQSTVTNVKQEESGTQVKQEVTGTQIKQEVAGTQVKQGVIGTPVRQEVIGTQVKREINVKSHSFQSVAPVRKINNCNLIRMKAVSVPEAIARNLLPASTSVVVQYKPPFVQRGRPPKPKVPGQRTPTKKVPASFFMRTDIPKLSHGGKPATSSTNFTSSNIQKKQFPFTAENTVEVQKKRQVQQMPSSMNVGEIVCTPDVHGLLASVTAPEKIHEKTGKETQPAIPATHVSKKPCETSPASIYSPCETSEKLPVQMESQIPTESVQLQLQTSIHTQKTIQETVSTATGKQASPQTDESYVEPSVKALEHDDDQRLKPEKTIEQASSVCTSQVSNFPEACHASPYSTSETSNGFQVQVHSQSPIQTQCQTSIHNQLQKPVNESFLKATEKPASSSQDEPTLKPYEEQTLRPEEQFLKPSIDEALPPIVENLHAIAEEQLMKPSEELAQEHTQEQEQNFLEQKCVKDEELVLNPVEDRPLKPPEEQVMTPLEQQETKPLEEQVKMEKEQLLNSKGKLSVTPVQNQVTSPVSEQMPVPITLQAEATRCQQNLMPTPQLIQAPLPIHSLASSSMHTQAPPVIHSQSSTIMHTQVPTMMHTQAPVPMHTIIDTQVPIPEHSQAQSALQTQVQSCSEAQASSVMQTPFPMSLQMQAPSRHGQPMTPILPQPLSHIHSQMLSPMQTPSLPPVHPQLLTPVHKHSQTTIPSQLHPSIHMPHMSQPPMHMHLQTPPHSSPHQSSSHIPFMQSLSHIPPTDTLKPTLQQFPHNPDSQAVSR